MARLFFAVDVPPAVREEAVHVADTLRPLVPENTRWVPEDQLHLTLKFIEELGSDRIPKLAASVAGKLARMAPFEASIAGLGAFPNNRAARVIWLGLGAGQGPLARAARALDSSAARAGAPRERRPYRGHLTLARLPEPAPLPAAGVPKEVPFSVGEVVLYESRLSSAGATHVPLTRIPLGPSEESIEFAPEL